MPMDYVCTAKLMEYVESSNPWGRLVITIPRTQVPAFPYNNTDWSTFTLREGDISFSAIDFHVSGVIDEILKTLDEGENTTLVLNSEEAGLIKGQGDM